MKVIILLSILLLSQVIIIEGIKGVIGPAAKCQRIESCNGEMCSNICKIGSVELDEWATNTVKFQRSLQLDRSMIYYEMIGTHNGAIAQDYEMGIEEDFLDELLKPIYPRNHEVVIANQRHSILDQLRMGVRHIEVDLYFFDYLGGIKVCHWPVCPPDFFLIVENAAKQQGIENLNWDCGNLGCDQRKPFYEKILLELRSWLDQNKDEFITIYIDNKNINKRNIPEFVNVTEFILGDLLFRPSHKREEYPNNWPTINQLLQKNRRVLIENNDESWIGDDLAEQTVFTPPLWVQFGPSSFDNYPDCTVNGNNYYAKQLTRSLDGSLVLGPAFLWEGRSDYPFQTMKDMSVCSINIQSLDQIIPDYIQYFVWSWERDQPSPNYSCALFKQNSRWVTSDCNQSYYSACVSNEDETEWRISENESSWGLAKCPQGFSFSFPRTGYLNSKLKSISNQNNLWINYKTK